MYSYITVLAFSSSWPWSKSSTKSYCGSQRLFWNIAIATFLCFLFANW